MSHGFRACDHFGPHDLFVEFTVTSRSCALALLFPLAIARSATLGSSFAVGVTHTGTLCEVCSLVERLAPY